MRDASTGKIHIFIIMFFISLVMRMQIPIFTPYAAAFGASSILIGVILSVTSFANLSGNLIVGPLVDKFGKKIFIVLPLFASSGFFIAHGLAADSVQLLIFHGLNGLALGFFLPASLTLLSAYAKNSNQQGKNIAINGMLTTIAGIAAPLIGGKLVEVIGYVHTYFFIGACMVIVGVYTVRFLKEKQQVMVVKKQATSVRLTQILNNPALQMIYLIGFAVMYIHGVIIYEIPYLTVEQGVSTFNTGQLFSYMGLGSFVTLAMLFINRFDPMKRLMIGLFGMSMTLFALFSTTLPLAGLLFVLGMFFGLIMPAMAAAITDYADKQVHGRAYGFMSAIYSLGIIASSFITGVIRDMISPYFVAFLAGMLVLTFVGYHKYRLPKRLQTS